MMRTLFIRRCPDYNAMLRFTLGLCAAVLIVLLLVLPDDAEAATGYLFEGNCYANVSDARNAYAQNMQQSQYFSHNNLLYRVRYYFNTVTNRWYERYEEITIASYNSTAVIVGYLVLGEGNEPFFPCNIPDVPDGLAGNGTPSVFSPIYEMARTLVNTQELMIFLWAVATFFLGFKFGYFVFNSGGGKHDTF